MIPLRAKRDSSEPEIVEVFREAKWPVVFQSAKGIPDLLTGPAHGPLILVEVKSGNATLTEDQRAWHEAHPGWPIHIVRNAAQARKLVRMVEPSSTGG